MEILEIKKLSNNSKMPIKAYDDCAGYDLASAEDMLLLPHSYSLIKTDLVISLPKNTYGRIADRSTIALKSFVSVGGGVIDVVYSVSIGGGVIDVGYSVSVGGGVSDVGYFGPVGVNFFNHGNEPIKIKQGERISQLIIERICPFKLVEVDILADSARGEKAFGSSGK